MFESEADRLASLKAVGGEEFDTGKAGHLWAVFDNEFQESVAGDHVIESRVPMLTCRTSDAKAHDVKKQSLLIRLSDGARYTVRRIEPDGTGMSIIQLSAAAGPAS